MFEGKHNRSYKRLVNFIKSQGEYECVGYEERRDAIDDMPFPDAEEL